MNVTLLTTRLFAQPTSGGELCTARLLAGIAAAGHQVRILGRGEARTAATLNQVPLGPIVAPFEALPSLRRVSSLLGALASRQASTVHRLTTGGAGRRARQHLLQCVPVTPDVLVVDHLQSYAWVADVQGRLPAPVLVMHNLESEGYAERAATETSPLRRAVLLREARLLQALARRALRAASVVACLSDDDARQLRACVAACGGHAPVEVLPGFASPEVKMEPSTAPVGAARRIGLLGTWTWGPNRAGLAWMLDRVLPLLPPACKLLLAGSGLEGCALPARTESLGRVVDVRLFYDSVDVVAIASHTGSGVQEKAIEAIASGLPVVASRHALRGLGPPWPRNVYVADDPSSFAHACATAAAAVGDGLSPAQWSSHRGAAYRAALARCLAIAVRSGPPRPHRQ